MVITDVIITPTKGTGRQLADVAIVMDNEIRINNIKLIDNGRRRFVEFSKSPRTDPNIDNPDVVPLNRQTRAYIEKTVLEQYDSYEGGGIGT